MKTIEQFTGDLIAKLKRLGFVVQRNDSAHTNSVYLRLDYGVCEAIRISDHKGKSKLNYKFNFTNNPTQRSGVTRKRKANGFIMFISPFYSIAEMLKYIVRYREERYEELGGKRAYEIKMQEAFCYYEGTKGFWSNYKMM